ncbi:MAG: arsenite methyltransferase [Negativicutes bacterium]|nr:arsenite methyltransferase [Negativicutes bacterium]
MKDKETVREAIRKRYGSIAKNQPAAGCCSNGCDCNGTPIGRTEASLRLGYTEEDLKSVPPEANLGLGCGNPLAIAALKPGETVLDLGSGGGFDCFLARRQVGEQGLVIGVDMTPAMIKLARKNLKESGYTNVEFRLGEIEHLPVADATVDVIISNCVINLSVEKEQVFKEAYRVLKKGGRLSVSDSVATVELPPEAKQNLSKITGCIAGAESIETLKSMLRRAGFTEPVLTPRDNSKEIIAAWIPGSKIEDYVASYLIEAVK